MLKTEWIFSGVELHDITVFKTCSWTQMSQCLVSSIMWLLEGAGY